jgi:hypothetical protein
LLESMSRLLQKLKYGALVNLKDLKEVMALTST